MAKASGQDAAGDGPPAGPVPWIITNKATGKSVTVVRQTAFEAYRAASPKLGSPGFHGVECKLAPEPEPAPAPPKRRRTRTRKGK